MINLILTLTNLILIVKLKEALKCFEELNAQYKLMKESEVKKRVKYMLRSFCQVSSKNVMNL
jgi:hypothetical protein